ncbi:MAG: hypothetical protein MI802_09670 [Desulfobacterales bacterium]|nr:hypothetical protein [Desulfobacterales bacterium]
MAHEYSVLIHGWISRKKELLDRQIRDADADTGKDAYHRGQMDALMEIRQYLTDRIDLDTQTYYD